MTTGSHCRGPASITGQPMWHLKWTRWHYNRFLSQYIPTIRHTHLNLNVTLNRRTSGRRQLFVSMLHREQSVPITKTSPLTVCNLQAERQHTVHCAGHWTAYNTNRSSKGEERSRLSQLTVMYCICTWEIGWQHVLAQKDHLQIMNVSKLLRRITGLCVVCRWYLICTTNRFILKCNWGVHRRRFVL